MTTIHEKTKDLLKMLGGAIVVAGSAVWFLSHQIHSMENRVIEKIALIDKRVTVIETVLVLQGYPIKHLVATEKDDR